MSINKNFWAGFLFTFLTLGFASCENSRTKKIEVASESPALKESVDEKYAQQNISACQSDQDCTEISDGCCGCRNGGEQKAIAKKYFKASENAQAAQCAAVSCIMMISTHESCSKKAVCEQGECVLR